MKTLLFIIAVAVVGLVIFSCRTFLKAEANSETQNAGQTTNWDDYKNILFVDQTLEEIVKLYKVPDNPFIQAYNSVNSGKPEEAKKILKQVLADTKSEVRTKLWAWNALRQLGEKPSPNIANEVQGVVMEVPVENWVDTLAAYSDGRARYLNGKGGAIVWEAPEETRINSLINNFIKATQTLVEKAPIYNKHQPTKSDVVRISILTYGGIHIIEAKQSSIMDHHILLPTYNEGTQLFLALLEENEKSNQKQ